MAQYGCTFASSTHAQLYIAFLVLLCGNLPSLKAQDFVFSKDKYVEQNVSINLNHSLFTVSEKFLSVAIDSSIMKNHWHKVNFTSDKFFTLARALSPALLRIGGTEEDFLIYDDSNGLQKFKNYTNFTITHQDLDKIHLLSSKAGWDVMFGLNVLLRERDGSWNASNAKKIMQYVAEHGYHFGWELGNEPNLFKDFNKSVSPEELANDFQTLRTILKSSPQFGNYLIGPDVTRILNHSESAHYLESFVSRAKDVIDAVTWHQYYLNGRTCSEEDFYNPDVLDYFLHELNAANNILAKIDPDIPRWLGETSSAYGGGAPGLSDRYIAGFLWLDKLGLAARLGHDVVIRQTFVAGNYALLDEDWNPNPDYWLSLLYKRLVGVKVLEVHGGTEEKRTIRIYAHCSSKKYPMGSVTLLVLNVHKHDPVVLKLTGSLRGKDVEEYLLTAENTDLTSKTVRLNGKTLKLVDDRTLPDLIPVSVPGDQPLILPPLTFGLYVIPGASAGACR